jgi:hypothetical protein
MTENLRLAHSLATVDSVGAINPIFSAEVYPSKSPAARHSMDGEGPHSETLALTVGRSVRTM